MMNLFHHAGGFGERPKPTVIVRMEEGDFPAINLDSWLVWLSITQPSLMHIM